MRVTVESPSHYTAALVLVLAAALAVLGLVHVLTTAQLPEGLPGCDSQSVIDTATMRCERVNDTLER